MAKVPIIIPPLFTDYKLYIYRDWIFVEDPTGWLKEQIKRILTYEEEPVKNKNKDSDIEEVKVEPFNYQLYIETNDEFAFLTGLLPYVRSMIKLPDDAIIRKWEPTSYGEIDSNYLPGITLRSYQVAAANKILKLNKGIIQIPTRGGKTEVAIAAWLKYQESHPNAVGIFIEPSALLMDQTYHRFIKRGATKVGRLGSGYNETEGNKVYICLIDSLYSMIKKEALDFDAVTFLFIDECQCMGAPSYVETLRKFISLDILVTTSGTPFVERDDYFENIRDAYVIGRTNGVIFLVNSSYLVDNRWIAQGNVIFLEYSTKRLPYMSWNYRKVYDYYILKNKIRNQAASRVAYDLYSRGLKVLLLVSKIAHGDAIMREIYTWNKNVVFANGTFGVEFINEQGEIQIKEKGFDAASEFNKGSIPILIGSDIFKLGADLPELDAVVMLRGEGRSHVNTVQSSARCLVQNEWDNNVFIVDFMDVFHPYTKAHSNLRRFDYTAVGYQIYDGYENFINLINSSYQARNGHRFVE